MALDFYIVENSFGDSENWGYYMQEEPEAFVLVDQFELDEYDKLNPWIELCLGRGLQIGRYFDDTFLKHEELGKALRLLRSCYGEIAARRPFYHASEAHRQPFTRMIKVLERALADGRGVMAFCD